MNSLSSYESHFEKAFFKLDKALRQKAGALLPIIPPFEEWDSFLQGARNEWQKWQYSLTRYPNCLLVLYAGLAFYEYDENTFWPQFAKAIGRESIPPNRQSEINSHFFMVAEKAGLRMLQRHHGKDYVGSAVYYIGIPLSLWDGFIEICEWALWQEGWERLTDEKWTEAIGKRVGGRQRLRKFLIDNRDAAVSFIKEILDARRILTESPNYTITDLSQACFLRPEYFTEVPETAEFLLPHDPESLFRDRARLTCDFDRCCISIRLPAVSRENLPAIWSIGTHTQEAAATPDELVLNSRAFDTHLILDLDSGIKKKTQRLRGLETWGLFDMEKGVLVNTNRQWLPIRSYAVISSEILQILSRKGFEEDENPINEPFELSDACQCYITRLWPTGKYAELVIRYYDTTSKITFRTRSKIEAHFFAGKGNRAAYFTRFSDNSLKVENLPLLCLVIPNGYFQDIKKALNDKFRVLINDKPARGEWIRHNDSSDEEKELFEWMWASPPFFEKTKTGSLKDFRDLKGYYKSPDLKGDRIVCIRSPEFKKTHNIYLDHSKRGMDKCWKNLPGAFLPWFLLCQSATGMKWEDLLLAKDLIAPKERIAYHQLRKFADKGLFLQKGRYWVIGESRATLRSIEDDRCELQYCGDPSILWSLYRRMYQPEALDTLPIIEVVAKRGGIPYLQMTWQSHQRDVIVTFLKKKGVILGNNLWTV